MKTAVVNCYICHIPFFGCSCLHTRNSGMIRPIENPFVVGYSVKTVLHASSDDTISKICVKWSVFADPVTYIYTCFTFQQQVQNWQLLMNLLMFEMSVPPFPLLSVSASSINKPKPATMYSSYVYCIPVHPEP